MNWLGFVKINMNLSSGVWMFCLTKSVDAQWPRKKETHCIFGNFIPFP